MTKTTQAKRNPISVNYALSYRSQPHITTAAFARLKPGTWLEVKFPKSANDYAMVLAAPADYGDDELSLNCYYVSTQSHGLLISREQVVQVFGTQQPEGTPETPNVEDCGKWSKFTAQQRSAAFLMVAPKLAYKDAIDVTVDYPGERNIECLEDAIIEFTGVYPLLSTLRNGAKLRVRCDGYAYAVAEKLVIR